MALHAGHGLTYHNVRPIAAIEDMHELNIGHSIVARALDGWIRAGGAGDEKAGGAVMNNEANSLICVLLAFSACSRTNNGDTPSSSRPAGTSSPESDAGVGHQTSHLTDAVGETLEFPTRGLRLTAPAGWQRNVVDRGKG